MNFLSKNEKNINIADEIYKSAIRAREQQIEQFKLNDAIAIITACRKAALAGETSIVIPVDKYKQWEICSLEENGFKVQWVGDNWRISFDE